MIAFLIRLVTGVQARWRGCSPEPRQRIYFANHASNLDGPTIWAALPRPLRLRTRPVAAQDYWDAGPIRRFLANRVFHVVLIARTGIKRDNNPLVRMESALAEGHSLIIFPEGRRSLDDDAGMNAFKPGLFHLAQKHPEIEFVPVYLENLNRIMPKGEYLIVPLIAAASFGPPIRLGEGESKQAFLDRSQAAVAALGVPRGSEPEAEAQAETEVRSA